MIISEADQAIEMASGYLDLGGDYDKRKPTFEERSALRKVLRMAQTAREQAKIVKMAVENAATLVERA